MTTTSVHPSRRTPAVCGRSPEERMLKLLQATPEQLAAIDRMLDGQPAAPPTPTGPLLLMMGDAAKRLGVSRATVWRMMKSGRLGRVEIMPGSFRVRRAEVEALAGKADV